MKMAEILQSLGHKPELPFSDEEYRRRLDGVLSQLGERGIDVLVVSNSTNIAYLTGYDTMMPPGYSVLIVSAGGDMTLHCSELEAPCMLYTGNVTDVQVFYWYEAQDTGTDLARILNEGGYGGKTIGLEMGYPETFGSGAFDTKSYLTLQRELPGSLFEDATDIVLNVRLIKVAEELDYMRQAGRYTWAGLKAGLAAVREGVTDNDVIAELYHGLIKAGSENMSIDPMIMSGERTGWLPHIAFRRNLLQAGDPIYFEVTGTHYRYNAPSMRSAVVGEPSAQVEALAQACFDTLGLVLDNIRPGRTGDDVAQIAKAGYADVPGAFFHGAFGYSIGMSFKPSWTENPVYIAEGAEDELRPGMTFHLPICIWEVGKYGVGFSESVVVTEEGCECLTPNEGLELVVGPVLEQSGR
jgi:Xaa-Pro aminopeptidase